MEAPAREFVEWVPKQVKPSEINDYRAAARGPKGYKEKRKRTLDESEEVHQADLAVADSTMEEDAPEPAAEPSSKRRKAEGMAYIPVSGRTWKTPAQRASIIMKPKSNVDTWGKKMEHKASRQQFLEQKRAAAEASKSKRKASSKQKREAIALKKANQLKSQVVQKITNNATLKKMMKSKKQKKTLQKADTN